MWQLYMMKKTDKEWSEVGHLETLTDVAKRIIALDDATTNAVFFEFHVLATMATPDSECLAHFEHTGKTALFSVKQRRQ